jgi:aminoglycoside 6-adenylyltransferase
MKKGILDKIIGWAENENEIKAIILEASRSSGKVTDELSDYDINLFVTNNQKYLNDNSWICLFDEVIVYQKTKYYYKEYKVPTRLVVYKNQPRVDFSFMQYKILEELVSSEELTEPYKNGYKVLLDKTGLCSKLKQPDYTGFTVTKPSKDEVLTKIYNFYFEAYSVAKFLKREALWYSKILENGYLKQFLLDVILWNESYKRNWTANDIHLYGKNLESKLSPELIEELSECFTVYGYESTKASLYNTMDLFSEISSEFTNNIGIDYPYSAISEIKYHIYKILEEEGI